MKNIHLFVDGTWLFKTCKPGGFLAKLTATPEQRFKMDFQKFVGFVESELSDVLGSTICCGKKYIASSVFDIAGLNPPIDKWPEAYTDEGITPEMIVRFRNNITARTNFIDNAVKFGGFFYDANHESLKPHIVVAIANDDYREKQVDSKVQAELIDCGKENKLSAYYAVLTGDLDMMPALKKSYPEWSDNVILLTTEPNYPDGVSSFDMVKFVNENFKYNAVFIDKHFSKFLHIDRA